MSRICFICGKKPVTGMQVSHSHRRSKRKWFPNLQKLRIVVEGRIKRASVCTKCMKAGKIKKAP